MTEEIDVLIEGSGDDGLMRTAARGAARRVAGSLHVLFEEEMGENCDRAKSHLVVRDRLVEVHRRGAVKTDLIFREDEVTRTAYETPDLSFSLEVHTKKLSIHRTDERIEIHIRYALFSGGGHIRDAEVRMVLSGSLLL